MARSMAGNRTIRDLKAEEENKKIAISQNYKQACEEAGVKNTTRQARKFRQGRGKAFEASQKSQKNVGGKGKEG